MEIHYVVAKDMRKALLQIKQKLGSEALIISHKSVDGGIEVQAAIERKSCESAPETPTPVAPVAVSSNTQAIPMVPETSLNKLESELKLLRSMLENQVASLAWQQEKYLRPIDAVLIDKLSTMGFPRDFVKRELGKIENIYKIDEGVEALRDHLSRQIVEAKSDILRNGGIMALVGPTGVGKTTTLAKLATKFVFMHSRHEIAIINTDNYRIGARDQLNTYATILDIPVYNVSNKNELDATLNALSEKKLVLIDTSGVILETNEIIKRIYLQQSTRSIHCYLTISASTDLDTLKRTIELFSCLPINHCILTKLDETKKIGQVLSVLIERQLAVAYTSDGQRVPEDIHSARGTSLIARAFNTEFEQEFCNVTPYTELEEVAVC